MSIYFLTHMCHFFIEERRGAYSSICVEFLSGSGAAATRPICVNLQKKPMGASSCN
ncbi:MAG TPA: hypothetical protein P5322_04335 [Spirochaetota bacterium]|nr:hypothetical protein [Spirochaetota bacterium]HRU43735.1 hypothetical protein [Spirochaetota bacterium]